MKKLLLVAAILAPASAMAGPVLEACDYQKDNGREFTFLQADPSMSFKNRMGETVYPYFVDDRFKGKTLSVDKYQYRHAKLETKSFFRRMENLDNGNVAPVRYYKALVDNCDTVWVRVDETKEPISRYMDKENNLVSGNVPWNRVDENLSVRFSDTYSRLQSLVGKKLTVVPFRDESEFKGKSLDSQKWVSIKDFSQLTIEKVLPSDFVYQGHRLGSIQLQVKLKTGEVAYIPWNPERLFVGNPFNSKKITAKHYGDIKRGEIRFGMNIDEVMLAWGEPELLRYLPVHEINGTKAKFVQDDQYPYGDLFTEYKTTAPINSIVKGKYIELYYPDRLRKSETLKFNQEGKLLESEQTKGLHKAEIYKPIAHPIK